MTHENAVVVAIDDEDPDLLLLGWAAAEAAFRGTRLVICHVCEWRPGDQPPRPMDEGRDPDLRLGPERVVAAALDAVRARLPGPSGERCDRHGQPRARPAHACPRRRR